MDQFVMPLPVALDVVSLTMGLVNIPSPSGTESALADSVEQALRTHSHLTVERVGNTVVARTELGHAERTVLVGHLGTAAAEDEAMAYVEMGKLFGVGAGTKGGLAVMLKAAALGEYDRDATFVFHDGLTDLVSARPDLCTGDLIVVMEPTDLHVEVDDLPSSPATAFAAPLDTEPVLPVRSRAQVLARVGVPALTFGPGDPVLAGAPDEYVPTAQLTETEHVLRQWLRGS